MEFNKSQKLMSVAEKKIEKKSDYTDDKYEQRTEKWVMKSNVYKKMYKSPGLVYDYLWAQIRRRPSPYDKYNIYEEYFSRGQLACCPKIETIARECKLDQGTVRNHIKVLIECGVIQKHTKRLSKKVIKNIYILGFITKEDKEIMFLEDVARKEVG